MSELTKNTEPKAQVSDFGLDREFDGYLYHATSAHNLTKMLPRDYLELQVAVALASLMA